MRANKMNIVDMHAHMLLDRLYVGRAWKGRPILPGFFGNCLGFDALSKGQVGVVVSSIYPFWWPTRRSAYMDRCSDIIKLIEAYLAEHCDKAALVTGSDGIERAMAQGKIAFIHAVEGGHVLEGRLENLERLHQLGVRSLILTHFVNNDVAASAFDPRRKLAGGRGLTPLGRKVVTRMNDLGMIVDLTHCSERAFWQALEMTQHPVMVSHTGARHFVPYERCLSDDQIKAIARNGGVVGIVISPVWLKRFQLVTDISDLVDNILYVCSLVGTDHVGIASDFNGTPRLRGVKTAKDFPRVAACLSKAAVGSRCCADNGRQFPTLVQTGGEMMRRHKERAGRGLPAAPAATMFCVFCAFLRLFLFLFVNRASRPNAVDGSAPGKVSLPRVVDLLDIFIENPDFMMRRSKGRKRRYCQQI